jgi:glycosyltransferase involved in cell wall biosynthesis
MPAFNAEAYIFESLQSILEQTYIDFELIIIDDASTDSTGAIVRSLHDVRLKYYRNNHNCGLAASLNKGIAISKGTYIARIDADDIATPDRLGKQVVFLDQNSEVGVVGSNARYFYTDGSPSVVAYFPENHADIKLQSFFSAPFSHPTVMLRRSAFDLLDQWYNPDYESAEDFELWTRLLEVTNGANIQEVLLLQRRHAQSVTHRPASRRRQLHNTIRAMYKAQKALCPLLTEQATKRTLEFSLGRVTFLDVYETYECICQALILSENSECAFGAACNNLIVRSLKHDASAHKALYIKRLPSVFVKLPRILPRILRFVCYRLYRTTRSYLPFK